jgi:hypothetical protein
MSTTPRDIQSAIAARACKLFPTNADAAHRGQFCKKVLLGAAFFDVPIIISHMPGNLCEHAKIINDVDVVVIKL